MDGTDEIKVLVVMREQADIEALDATLRATRAPLSQRHRQVIDALREVAERTQAPIARELTSERDARIRGFAPYWILNALTVVGTVDAVRDLAQRPDVELIEPDLRVELIEPVESYSDKVGPSPRGSVTPGVLAIQADRVWNELGIDGAGALVGGMDTGVDGTHPALADRWRGNFAPWDECWRDAVGFGDATPVDRHGHGTHTMGTMTGTAPGNEIGVAPGALWIADNSINQGVGTEFDNDVLTGLQWFADPDGNSGTTEDVPDVVQHSWGVYENLGYPDCDSRWWTAIDNCEAAGVVNTWSAGNEGPSPASLRSPADRSDSPYNAFSVGSTQHSPPYTISGFSSRGPSTCPGTLHPIKPEVVAPGSNIWSAVPGGGYGNNSGTSMAGPHVAGTVALMRAANPDIDVDTIKQILMSTATDLGPVGEENTYGNGFINAYDAVVAVLSGYGEVAGTVTESGSGSPLPGALVDVLGDPRSAITDLSGDFSMFLPAGDWTLEYSAFGYVTTTQNVTVVADGVVDASIALAIAPQAVVSGTVFDFEGATVDGATITVLDTPLESVLSQANGTYAISVPDLATYDIRARKDGFGSDQHSVIVNGATTQDFTLPELVYEDFESGDFLNWPWTQGGDAPWTIDTGNVYEGVYSARSGSISHNQQSSMQMDLYLVAGGDVSFWFNVSSEANYDFLRFYIDGAQQNSWSGSVPWTEATYPVSSGLHTFEWRYDKDGSVSTGSDAAWVDFINFPTVAFPEIDVVPGSLEETLPPDQSVGRTLTINNTGEAPLDYSVEILGAPAPGRDMGGPDNFGYRWVDSDQAGGPEYAWFDISAVGTPIPLGNEDISTFQPLGFNFSYYGNVHTAARACANGYLTLTSIDVVPTNGAIPNPSVPNNFIAPFWDDLNPGAGGTVYSYQDVANNRFIVQWDDVPRASTGAPQTFQAIIQSNGRIVFQYQTVSEADECTVGIENRPGDDGLEVAFNAPYLHDGLAILFTDETPPEWLSVSPTSGTVAPSSSADLLVTFDSTDLADGVYVKTIRLHTNDSDERTVDVVATLTVAPGATDVSVLTTPATFQLSAPRPNPFGSATAIDYAVPADGAHVRIVVFDVSGRLVRTLVNQTRPAGRYSVAWDGRDSGGQRAASGVYFYRMDAGEFSRVQKVTLLK
jgi:subtilisin family serine protease